MLRRILLLVVLAWALGFAWFVMTLPQPRSGGTSDAAVVLTGGSGRIDRGLEVLGKGWARKLLVSGVDRNVKPHEFAVHYKVAKATMACCITLGFESVDTESNARETARWIARNRIGSIRLITSDWHMRRAAFELARMKPDGVSVVRDAVATHPSLRALFVEYHKLLARWIAQVWGG